MICYTLSSNLDRNNPGSGVRFAANCASIALTTSWHGPSAQSKLIASLKTSATLPARVSYQLCFCTSGYIHDLRILAEASTLVCVYSADVCTELRAGGEKWAFCFVRRYVQQPAAWTLKFQLGSTFRGRFCQRCRGSSPMQ